MKSENKKMSQKFEARKKEHIVWALNSKTQSQTDDHFDWVRLIHQPLPEINLSDVGLKTQILKKTFSSPHFIGSMTAGHAQSKKINLRLAEAAAEKNWLMCVGSQRRELTDEQAQTEWKSIRKLSPKTQFVSNIGLEELIQTPLKNILKLAENLEALGLIIHVNPLQEALQKKNQANFSGGLKAIEKISKNSEIPIIVKEVGFGMDLETVKRLFSLGVSVVDVSGKGGTHWGLLEGLRHQKNKNNLFESSQAFKDWGYSTIESLLMCNSLAKKNVVWASGGIRSGVHSAKCLALGAKAVGIAQPMMKAAVSSKLAVLNVMDQFDYELKVALFCTGVVSLKQLDTKKVLDFL